MLRKSKRFLQRILKDYYLLLHGIPRISNDEITPDEIKRIVAREDPIILEIGCNDGANTEWYLRSFSRPTIHCFEPDPRAIERFRRRIGINACVHLHEVAVCNVNGTVRFHQSSGNAPNNDDQNKERFDWDLSGSIKNPKEHRKRHPWCKFETSIETRAVRLDDWSKMHSVRRVDFIWMDVQGAEKDVFLGGKALLQNTGFLYTEYSDRELYEGQVPLIKLKRHLRSFKIRKRYVNDVLFENTKLT
jgi:FkbM family methyltransferase